ncbi:MAG TPA: glucosidase [Verrucomicrobiae bacterium]|nr:glucosidase [Verrucomicrobiae bacterium]
MTGNPEKERLEQANTGSQLWKKWGPYLSERQWGTVREDYSESGNAWEYFPHDHARSRAYRWGEDGIAGISDDKQRLCFALAFWNGQDPILKERLFGLTNSEGNHGEDVKEYYFYLDSTPTHSYMKYLYKYPQRAFPYADLVETNRRRNRNELEYELLDTGVFGDDRYFDIFVEYAKESAEEILVQITVWNRGSEAAELHVLPTLWFRNNWAYGENVVKPSLGQVNTLNSSCAMKAFHPDLGDRFLYCENAASLLFTENETNCQRIYGTANATPYVKDGINNYLIHGQTDAINPGATGTKASAHSKFTIAPGKSETIRLRLSQSGTCELPFGSRFDEIMQTRSKESDRFYDAITPSSFTPDQARVFRQALAGMLWSKQFYNYNLNEWLKEHHASPFQTARRGNRNDRWYHMYNADILSMPDKWEYPWYAAWDLAFHVIALALVDEDFGKQQLEMILSKDYMHPNGQIPAYEWNFSDVNPPVHAWSAIFTYRLGQKLNQQGDLDWLERVFHKLLLNFNWWVNRKDRSGNNVFEGGFLGLDNIGVFDRSAPLPTGGYLDQADGTAWMALYCQNMLEIADELATYRPVYSDMYVKFLEHFLWIAASMIHAGGDVGMWDEEDGFFYDVLRLPDGSGFRLKVRSMVGLLPLCAVTVFDRHLIDKFPRAARHLRKFAEARPELTAFIHDPRKVGPTGRHLCAILNEQNLRRVLSIMLDENEFFSAYGIRALSRRHVQHPYVLQAGGREYRVSYQPAESNDGTFGGNSNWRGPIWMPVNTMIIRSLLQYYAYYGDSFIIECPTGSGRMMNLFQVAEEITRRLESIFLRDTRGRRPVYGGNEKFQQDAHWRDYLLFYEYFHGDNGAGIGAGHQTGWTGAIARAMHVFASTKPEVFLALGKKVTALTR